MGALHSDQTSFGVYCIVNLQTRLSPWFSCRALGPALNVHDAGFPAGFYLVLVQPFRLGDRVAVTCSIPGISSSAGSHAAAAPHPERNSSGGNYSTSGTRAPAGLQGWFEGVCEKVDLRYTVLRWGWLVQAMQRPPCQPSQHEAHETVCLVAVACTFSVELCGFGTGGSCFI
jgi:hypothetical protein